MEGWAFGPSRVALPQGPWSQDPLWAAWLTLGRPPLQTGHVGPAVGPEDFPLLLCPSHAPIWLLSPCLARAWAFPHPGGQQ